MAKGGGIWRTIRLALDRNSAKRMQTEAQAALKGATDPKAAKANLKKANSYFSETEAAVKKIAVAIGAAFAIKKIAAFGLDTIRMANAAEKSWRKLGASINAAGGDFKQMRPDLEKAARALQDISSIDDEGFADIMQRLTSKTGDANVALKNVDLTARVAATFFNGEFAPAADLVAKALNGQTKQLKLLGIEAGTTEARLKILSERSSHDVDTLAQLGNEWNNVKEEIGKALLEAGGGTSIIQTLTGALRGLTTWLASDGVVAMQSFAVATMNVFTALKAVGDFLGTGAGAAVGGIEAVFDKIAQVTGLSRRGSLPAELISKADLGLGGGAAPGLPGKPPKVVPLTAAEKAAIKKRAEEAAKIVEAARLKAALFSTRMVTMNDLPDPKRVGLAGGAREQEANVFAVLTEAARDSFRTIEDAAQGAAMGIAGAFQDTFSLMLQGFDNVGNAAVALGKGIAGALLGGVAQYAGSKVAENIALAFEEVAKGIAAASSILLAPTAPGHFAAAKMHGVAALKWGVLAGGAGAAQSAVSGGGRGGQSGGIPSGARDPGGRLNETLQNQPTVVNVYIDPLNPSDPAYQRNVHAAGQYARERFGENAVVSVHPRTGK